MNLVILYAACAVVFFPLDFVWILLMGDRLYRAQLGGLMLEQPNLAVAAVFYLIYVAGLVALVAAPANGDVLKAALYGAILGLVAYGTFDLTGLSILKGFTPTVALADLAWGTVLSAVTAGAGVWIAGRFVS